MNKIDYLLERFLEQNIYASALKKAIISGKLSGKNAGQLRKSLRMPKIIKRNVPSNIPPSQWRKGIGRDLLFVGGASAGIAGIGMHFKKRQDQKQNQQEDLNLKKILMGELIY